MEPRSLCILLVEDDEIETEFFLRCLRIQRSTLEVTVAHDAREALQILRGGSGKPPLTGPFVILLDLRLPRMTGFEFLQGLRSDPRLKAATVFVLTNAASEYERKRAYDCGIAGYLRKHVFIDNCAPLITFLELYRDIVEIPVLA